MHTSPAGQAWNSPHMQSGRISPGRMLHEIAVVGSQRRPQPLQLLNGERGSSVLDGRPSTFNGCVRGTQNVPQQRFASRSHELSHMLGGGPPSWFVPTHVPPEQDPEQALPHVPQ